MESFRSPSSRVAPRGRVRAGRRSWILGSLVAVLLALGSRPAEGYVRTRSKSGTPIAWRIPQLTLTVVRPTPSFSTSPETFLSTVQRSAAAWSHDAIPCADVSLKVDPVMADSGAVRNDGRATVMVTGEGWSHKLDAIALTTVFLRNIPGNPEDGEILDADIEINGTNYTWSDIPDDATSIRDYANDEDLRNALVHEMGHLLGLWHNCYLDGEMSLPDDQGQPSPNCMNATGEMLLATMYPSTEFAAIDKRTLSDDELAAICDIYPYTFQVAGAGCAVAPVPPDAANTAEPRPWRRRMAEGCATTLAISFAFLILRRRPLG